MDELRLTSITTGVSGGIRSGFNTVIYGLDVNGMLWALNPQENQWERIHNPQDGELQHKPEEPGDDTPSWRNL